MPLTQCQLCKKQISTAAPSCPGCGEPRPESGWGAPKSSFDGAIVFIMVIMALGAIGKFIGPGDEPAAKTARESAPQEIVYNSAWDGSVSQVERYLKRSLKDPDSFEAIEWGPVVPTDKGYLVRCLYRAKNSLGGYVIEQQHFTLDKAGTVLSAVRTE